VCASGARAVAQAAYARAVEWSDFELESATRALDRLVAFVKKEETYLVDPRTARCSFSEAEEDATSDDAASVSGTATSEETEEEEKEKPCAKKKRRRKKKKTQGASPSPSPHDGPVGGKQSFVTRHAFAEGFDATRALVRAVAAARADGTLMSVARPRGGARNANGGVKGTDTGTLFQRRRRSKPKNDKRKAKSDDAPSGR
jgi:cysteinyl-tRNA synthetase